MKFIFLYLEFLGIQLMVGLTLSAPEGYFLALPSEDNLANFIDVAVDNIPMPSENLVDKNNIQVNPQESQIGIDKYSKYLYNDRYLRELEEKNFMEEQAKNAHYEFKTTVRDGINDNSMTRSEIRNGLKVNGMYSYSDGFYKKAIYYEADENGYRIVKEELEKIGEGPIINENGTADITSSLFGKYSISKNDIVRRLKTIRSKSESLE